MNIEDSSLFDDIAKIRKASSEILGVNVVWYHASVDLAKEPLVCNAAQLLDVRSSFFAHSVACNAGNVTGSLISFSDPVGYCASEVGYLVKEMVRCDVGDSLTGEMEIGADFDENEIYFMMNENDYDTNDINDTYEYDNICLL